MVVCKYFLQGNCRFGQNCRFEHSYSSKYSYHANPQQQQQATTVTDAQLINQVQTDVQGVLNGKQWILSCYAPYKEKLIFPGIHDVSPEETRLFIYEAKINNNVDQAILHINNLVKEAHCKYERLLQPDATITKILRQLYKGETVTSPFGNENTFENNAGSIFRSAVQNPPLNQNTSSIFRQSPQSNPKDIFLKANDSVFTQNTVFHNQDTNAKSIFAQANQNVLQNTQAQSVFTAADQNIQAATDIFLTANKSFFGQNEKQNTPFSTGNIFQKTESISSGNIFENDAQDCCVYSKMDDLSTGDLEAFKSDSFKLGFIPEIAPPKELC